MYCYLKFFFFFFFFNDTATTEIYTLSLHDALPIYRQRGRQWKVLQRRSRELVPVFPRLVLHASADAAARLRMALLLKPEAGDRRVKHAKQREVLVLPRPLRQFNHWRRLLEYLSASIQYEMIVRRHERKYERELGRLGILRILVPFKPRTSKTSICATSKGGATSEFGAKRPKPASLGSLRVELQQPTVLPVGEPRGLFTGQL